MSDNAATFTVPSFSGVPAACYECNTPIGPGVTLWCEVSKPALRGFPFCRRCAQHHLTSPVKPGDVIFINMATWLVGRLATTPRFTAQNMVGCSIHGPLRFIIIHPSAVSAA